jgi:hypothetical protein
LLKNRPILTGKNKGRKAERRERREKEKEREYLYVMVPISLANFMPMCGYLPVL